MKKVAVFGLALTGTAVARALVERGYTVVLSDDRINDDHQKLATELNCELREVGSDEAIASYMSDVDTLLPAPGVPPHHAVIRFAESHGISIRTEIDVAYEWEQARPNGPRPILGVTGTDGKTTTTMIVAHLLRSTGKNVGEVGNTDLPFMGALNDPFDSFVVECSSFRLQYTNQFRCESSVWLNLAPDHLDWHPTLEHYTKAKAQLWAHARSTDIAVVPANNGTIRTAAKRSGARVVTFGLEDADYCVRDGWLSSPHGPLIEVSQLWRSMPHDITNSLAAAAIVLESHMVSRESLAHSLATFESAHHRIEFIGEKNGIAWYDDSKATSPHAALTAIRAFESVVLIAGGRNKGLDLSHMATEPQRMMGVVAIGDDAQLIAEAFRGVCEVRIATSMAEAVSTARSMAKSGDAVVLSPGCTSYDWYRNYNERGDDFTRSVREMFESEREKP
jgi:UDP-N-acetylmuramoylalanine--D-glutamate ligase